MGRSDRALSGLNRARGFDAGDRVAPLETEAKALESIGVIAERLVS